VVVLASSLLGCGAAIRAVDRVDPVIIDGGRALSFPSIAFNSSSAALTPEAREDLSEIARQLAVRTEARLELTLAPDHAATDLGLSVRRIGAIEAYLVRLGVPRARIQAPR
jgi:outer membrane protein OmpA-like peptidoglycan-associated protein